MSFEVMELEKTKRLVAVAPDEIEKPRYGIKDHTHLFLFFLKNLVRTNLTQMLAISVVKHQILFFQVNSMVTSAFYWKFSLYF